MSEGSKRGSMSVRSIRGAIQVAEDRAELVSEAVRRLVRELLARNGMVESDVIHIVFSQTKDLVTTNPASALRASGFGTVPLFCTQEPEYVGSFPRMIRVMITFEWSSEQPPVAVYLDGAERLRPDIGQ